MKCLSICQPFADLVASGRKSVELRSWNTGYRGEFLIHAPLKVRKEEARRLGAGREFVTGAIIGKAEIFGVRRYETESEWRRDGRLHLASGGFLGSRYGFMLRDARRFRVPIPCKGMLGFFEADVPSARASRSEIVADIIDEEHRYRWVGRH